MYIVFVIDTSASMNQRSSTGMTLLDCAKSAVEHFLKIRGRDTSIRNDRFFLITTEDGPSAVKAGWKEPFTTFVQELKNLSARDLSGIGPALKKAFDLLNQFRLQSGKDNYGQGRLPWIFDPSVIILITDGGALTTTTNILDTFTLPVTQTPGNELTQEPFRWDQRLYSIVLRFGAIPSAPPPLPEPLTSAMCEVTGGKTHIVTNMKSLLQTVDGLVQRMQPGVVVNFEPISMNNQNVIGPGPTLHRMLFVRNNIGFWPIPESFYLDPIASQLPPRTAHPTIRYTQVGVEPQVVDNFPFDKYELEPSPLTQFLLQNRGPAQTCWQTFVSGSGLNAHGEAFGYLKASTAGNVVNLFVLPYNYTKLFPLLEDLVRTQMSPTPKWRIDFENYMATIPPYYIVPMKTAMKRFGAPPSVVPDMMEGKLNPAITNYIAKLKQMAKQEPDRAKITKDNPAAIHSPVFPAVSTKPLPARVPPVIPRNYHQMLHKGSEAVQQPDEKGIPPTSMYNSDTADGYTFGGDNIDGLDASSYFGEISGLYDAPTTPSHSTQICKNAFDIDRGNLLEQIEKLRDLVTNKRKFEDDESKRVPIGEMGNYQAVLNKREVFRDVLDDEKSKRPLFGNPFRLEKGPKNAVDEADETEGEAAGLRRGRKKRQMPRSGSSSPSPSPPGSPLPSPPSSPSHPSSSPSHPSSPSQAPNTPPQFSPMHKKPPPSKTAKPHALPSIPGSPNVSGYSGYAGNSTQPSPHAHVQKQPKANAPMPLNSANIPLPSSPLPSHPATAGPPPTENQNPNAGALNSIPMNNTPNPTGPNFSGFNLDGNSDANSDESAVNNDVKAQVLKELRKPGKTNDVILEKLKHLKGGTDVKKAIVQEIIEHAKKYKKSILIGQLETFERTLG